MTTNYTTRTIPTTSYNSRTIPTTSYSIRELPTDAIYNNNQRISAYYLIDEEWNYIIDEEGNYIIIIWEWSDWLPLSDFSERTSVTPSNYTNRNPI